MLDRRTYGSCSQKGKKLNVYPTNHGMAVQNYLHPNSPQASDEVLAKNKTFPQMKTEIKTFKVYHFNQIPTTETRPVRITGHG